MAEEGETIVGSCTTSPTAGHDQVDDHWPVVRARGTHYRSAATRAPKCGWPVTSTPSKPDMHVCACPYRGG